MTEEDFLEKIISEGGIIEAINYGLSDEDCPDGDLSNHFYRIKEILSSRAFIESMNYIESRIEEMENESI
jgi:hypothetical protein